MTQRPRRVLVFALATMVLGWGCSTTETPRLTYEACAAGDTCDLDTACTQVPTSFDGGAGRLCTRLCRVDNDCPGLGAVCLSPGDSGDGGVCYRACAPGCRQGTTCVQSAAGGRGVCLP